MVLLVVLLVVLVLLLVLGTDGRFVGGGAGGVVLGSRLWSCSLGSWYGISPVGGVLVLDLRRGQLLRAVSMDHSVSALLTAQEAVSLAFARSGVESLQPCR